jgi:predicted transcriptional regulator
MRQTEKNRSRQEIMRDILATIEHASMSKTKVMYRAALSYTQLKYYEDFLQSNRLIKISNDDLWVLTEKGRQYLQVCKLADQILRMPASTQQESSDSDDIMTTAAGPHSIR